MLLMMHAFTKYNRVPDPRILSWVDEWDNPAFPLNLPPGPYILIRGIFPASGEGCGPDRWHYQRLTRAQHSS